jgi:hypothetical protein
MLCHYMAVYLATFIISNVVTNNAAARPGIIHAPVSDCLILVPDCTFACSSYCTISSDNYIAVYLCTFACSSSFGTVSSVCLVMVHLCFFAVLSSGLESSDWLLIVYMHTFALSSHSAQALYHLTA